MFILKFISAFLYALLKSKRTFV